MTKEEIIEKIENNPMFPYIQPDSLEEIVEFVIENSISLEDIELIDHAILAVDEEERNKFMEYADEDYYKEVFNRYMALKKKVDEVAEEIIKEKVMSKSRIRKVCNLKKELSKVKPLEERIKEAKEIREAKDKVEASADKLEQRILEESKRFPEVSFAKLSRIAKHFYDFGKQERVVEPQGLDEAAKETYPDEKVVLARGNTCLSCGNVKRDAFKAGAIWMFEKAPSEQAIAYVKASHSASEVSEFQAAMNIAAAKAFDAGAKWMAGQGWNIDSYQKQAQTFLLGKFQNMPMFELAKYCTLGLNEEAGEVAGKIKKSIRDADGKIDEGRIDAIVKEMGDVLWYLAIMAHALGVPLSSVASRNIEKLTDRKERDKIQGEGDNR